MISNHFPICLVVDNIDPYPFKFDNKWLKVNDFRDKVRGWWTSYNPTRNASYKIQQKLKFIKRKSRSGALKK